MAGDPVPAIARAELKEVKRLGEEVRTHVLDLDALRVQSGFGEVTLCQWTHSGVTQHVAVKTPLGYACYCVSLTF